MSRPFWILVAVLVLGALIVALAFVEEPPGLRGEPHSEIPAMRQGGDGAARHQALLPLGWTFGCAIILCLSAIVRFGGVRGNSRGSLSKWLHVATLLYLGAWSWLVAAYAASLADTVPDLVLGLPRPTAIMLFVFWPVSMLFSALFVVGFERWVLTARQEAEFERLVASREQQGQ